MPSNLVVAALAQEEAMVKAQLQKQDEAYASLAKKSIKLARLKKLTIQELEKTIAQIDDDPLPKTPCNKITYEETLLCAARQKSLDACERALVQKKKFYFDRKANAFQKFQLDVSALKQGMEIIKEQFSDWKREHFPKDKLADLSDLESFLAQQELRRLEEEAKPKNMSGLLLNASQCPELPGFNTEEAKRQLRDIMLFYNPAEYEVRFEVQHGDYVTEICLSDLMLELDPILQLERRPRRVVAAGSGATPREALERAVDVVYFGLFEK